MSAPNPPQLQQPPQLPAMTYNTDGPDNEAEPRRSMEFPEERAARGRPEHTTPYPDKEGEPSGSHTPRSRPPPSERMSFDYPRSEPVRRQSSRHAQMVRIAPPASEYEYDERYPRSPHGRPLPPASWRSYPHDEYPMRYRPSTIRESREYHERGGGGGPPPRPPRRGDWEAGSEYGDQEPLRPENKHRSVDNATPSSHSTYRLPFVTWMGTTARGHFIATIGEFMGTTLFLFFAFAGAQVARVNANTPFDAINASPAELTPIVLIYIAEAKG